MVDVAPPPVTPVIVTVCPELIVEAVAGALLAQTPPATELNNVVDAPKQPNKVPVIAEGAVLTVIAFVTKHPVSVSV